MSFSTLTLLAGTAVHAQAADISNIDPPRANFNSDGRLDVVTIGRTNDLNVIRGLRHGTVHTPISYLREQHPRSRISMALVSRHSRVPAVLQQHRSGRPFSNLMIFGDD
jgi:hypothetical protein